MSPAFRWLAGWLADWLAGRPSSYLAAAAILPLLREVRPLLVPFTAQ